MIDYKVSPEPENARQGLQGNQDEQKDKVWTSCCFKLSPRCLVYMGQFNISLIVLMICFYMLVKADGDCNKSSGYINLISFLLGKLLSSVASSN